MPVPEFGDYVVLIDGTLISYKCGKRLALKTKNSDRRHTITLRAPDSTRHKKRPYRLIAAAKYGRWNRKGEVVRHKNCDPFDNNPLNLEYGDKILNAIDEYLYGDEETTIEYIDHAIDLLMALREKMGA